MKLGVLVSGGDAPGINAALYSAWKTAAAAGAELWGVNDGFGGILEERFGRFAALDPCLIAQAGSILPTGRLESFLDESVRRQAVQKLKAAGFGGLMVIGGNGSMRAAGLLADLGFPTIGLPATVDGDVYATQNSVGFMTAVQAVSEEVAALHATAYAYPGRVFLLESLGGKSGLLALTASLSAGADFAVIPEAEAAPAAVALKVETVLSDRHSAVGVVCEGAMNTWKNGDQNCVEMYAEAILRQTGVRARFGIVGYGLRGKKPLAADAFLGGALARLAIGGLLKGQSGLIAGEKDGACALLKNDPACEGIPMRRLMEQARACDMLVEVRRD